RRAPHGVHAYRPAGGREPCLRGAGGGMKIWLTQSSAALTDLQPALQRRGHEVYRWPLVATERVNPQALDTARSALRDCRWLLFTSPAAVGAYLSEAASPKAGIAGEVIIGAVGP